MRIWIQAAFHNADPKSETNIFTQFEVPDAGLAVWGEGLLDVVHLDPLWGVPGPPEQAVDEHLEGHVAKILFGKEFQVGEY